MKLSTQLKRLQADLQEWASAQGGSAAIAGDPVHLWQLLQTKPGAVRAVVLWVSDDPRGEHRESGVAERSFTVVISRGRGFTLDRSTSLVDGAAGGAPLFDLVEEARDVLRGIAFAGDDTESILEVGRIGVFDTGQHLADAYSIDCQIGVQYPAIGTVDTE